MGRCVWAYVTKCINDFLLMNDDFNISSKIKYIPLGGLLYVSMLFLYVFFLYVVVFTTISVCLQSCRTVY